MRRGGHIIRMADERMLKQLFYVELAEGKRYWSKTKTRFKDSIRTTMKSLGMDPEDIETLALDRVRLKRDLRKNVTIEKIDVQLEPSIPLTLEFARSYPNFTIVYTDVVRVEARRQTGYNEKYEIHLKFGDSRWIYHTLVISVLSK
ncbi:Hypothetical predicted protein [Octopus vulgaris]|uniref:Uncharacterized protein n=1 Tax=Octopus vulgaris TaxID=6645 RepID=A0AA36C0K1_OCTVU|nr:Hypothetical predicted protein [Octopus vulgaris]